MATNRKRPDPRSDPRSGRLHTTDSNGTFTATGPNAQLGVYQKLSTRNGNEVVSSDSY